MDNKIKFQTIFLTFFIGLITILISFFLTGFKAQAKAPYIGHNSWHQLTTSNGLSAGIYSQKKREMTDFQPHIYSYIHKDQSTTNYMKNAYFGYQINKQTKWLNQAPLDKVEYVNGTNIIHAVQNQDNLTFDTYYFSPFSAKNKHHSSILYALIKVTNHGPQKDLTIFSKQNLNLGKNNTSKEEQTAYNSAQKYLKEFNSKNSHIAIYKNLVSQNSAYQTGTGNKTPQNTLKKSQNLNNTVAKKGNAIETAYQNKTTLQTGQSKWFGEAIGLREDGNETTLKQDLNLFNTPQQLLLKEENYWNNWHASENIPENLSLQQKNIYRQSSAVLKMSQVRESGRGNGQVLASLIPGVWSIAWVRDGSYSIRALIESGHFREARSALQFFLNAKMKKDQNGNNFYQTKYIENKNTKKPYYGLNTKLSHNYLLSVTRYFGNGTEESDANKDGPNIELDGWGLVLWDLNYYLQKTGDYNFLVNTGVVKNAQNKINQSQIGVNFAQFKLNQAKTPFQKQIAQNILNQKLEALKKEKTSQKSIINKAIKNSNWEKITQGDADLLTEMKDPQNGLIKPDSSNWEQHWVPFKIRKTYPSRQQFTYTDITAWAGLKAISQMAQNLGFKNDQTKYETSANKLRSNILKNLKVTEKGNQTLANSFERKGDAKHQSDGSNIEAINMGLIKPNSKLAQGMIKTYDHNLRVKTGNTPGYKRNQDGKEDDYNAKEWALIDFRIASALNSMGQKQKAQVLTNWISSQASYNFNLIPELLNQHTQNFDGSVPMGGFGSGSYILTLNDLY